MRAAGAWVDFIKMNSTLEGFLKIVKNRYAFKFPDVVTKENINIPRGGYYILDLAIANNYKNASKILIQMGGKTNLQNIVRCNPDLLTCVLESGANTNHTLDFEDFITWGPIEGLLLIDYNVKPPPSSPIIREQFETPTKVIEQYVLLSNARARECKKCLLTISYACTISPFRALREILLCAARQVWVMKGVEGCGPRGHLWLNKWKKSL